MAPRQGWAGVAQCRPVGCGHLSLMGRQKGFFAASRRDIFNAWSRLCFGVPGRSTLLGIHFSIPVTHYADVNTIDDRHKHMWFTSSPRLRPWKSKSMFCSLSMTHKNRSWLQLGGYGAREGEAGLGQGHQPPYVKMSSQIELIVPNYCPSSHPMPSTKYNIKTPKLFVHDGLEKKWEHWEKVQESPTGIIIIYLLFSNYSFARQ